MKKEIKSILNTVFPPFIISLYKGYVSPYGFFGNYLSWAEAKSKTDGYASELILKKVKDSVLKVKKGEAVCERDSVLFDKIEYSWPMLAGLMKACVENRGRLSVLDFGGSLGTSYFQNKLFLQGINDLKWGIVDQENFVRAGNENFADTTLRFYYNLEDCVNDIKPNVILLSSVIQYIEKPFDLLDKILKFGFQYILIDRTPLLQEKSRIVIQRVNPQIYKASFPCWLLNEQELVAFLSGKYNLLSDFDAIDGEWFLHNSTVKYRGYILKSKSL